MSATPRCGDSVYHAPSGETWLVAWCDGERLAWAGWPDGTALAADCAIVKRATDEEHRTAVDAWRKTSGGDSRRNRVLAMYGGDKP